MGLRVADEQSEANATQGNDHSGDGAPVRTVARRVLGVYFDELEATPGFETAAAKLRLRVLDDGALNEAAVRAALFADLA